MDSAVMSSESSAGRRFAGGGKSMFLQTLYPLNRRQQYSKPKGDGEFGEISLGMRGSIKDVAETARPSTTMNLLPLLEKSKADDYGSSSEPETAQMTILYGGQVLVFNHLTAEKANEVMHLASTFSNSNPSSSSVGAATLSNINLPQERPSSPIPIACDVRISRKASLQRFLEMRKNRIGGRSPYGMRNSLASPSKSGGDEGKAWLELAACESAKVIVGELDPNIN